MYMNMYRFVHVLSFFACTMNIAVPAGAQQALVRKSSTEAGTSIAVLAQFEHPPPTRQRPVKFYALWTSEALALLLGRWQVSLHGHGLVAKSF